jgi:hypothetical protein
MFISFAGKIGEYTPCDGTVKTSTPPGVRRALPDQAVASAGDDVVT